MEISLISTTRATAIHHQDQKANRLKHAPLCTVQYYHCFYCIMNSRIGKKKTLHVKGTVGGAVNGRKHAGHESASRSAGGVVQLCFATTP